KARATFTARLGTDHPDTLRSMGNLAGGLLYAGRYDRALPLLEETLALRKAKLGPDHRDTFKSMSDLADGYFLTGQLDRALPLYEETLALRKAKLGPDHSDTIDSMLGLARCFRNAAKIDPSYRLPAKRARVVSLLEDALPVCQSRLGPDHP